MRYSSARQRHGTSLDRQQEVLDAALQRYRLVLDTAYTDRAQSASKGHHREHGELGGIIESVDRGEFLNDPHVLVVEAMDRLVREGAALSMPMLSNFVRHGLFLVFGSGATLGLWCKKRMDSHQNHAVVAAINDAHGYTQRLSEFALAKQKRSRGRFAALAVEPSDTPPLVTGPLPGWLDKIGGRHVLNDHAKTVKRIFEMCASGMTSLAIAERSRGKRTPGPVGRGEQLKCWRAAQIVYLLRNERVLGLHQPRHVREGVEVLGEMVKVPTRR